MIDMRTVLFSYIISNAICAVVMASLWRRNRRRSPELAFWLADFIMQFAGLSLIILRGVLPDFLSMVVSNALVIGGTLLLFIGLERYTRKTSPQWHNYIYLALFVSAQMYFVYVQPSLQARNINISLGLLVICSQCVWLLLRRVEPAMKPDTRDTGVVFGIFSMVSLIRIFLDLAVSPGNDIFESGLYDTLMILTYQMLYISLTFALFLMVSRRLLTTLESDITERTLAEEALKVSEEKFASAFHTSPYAVTITRAEDGKFIDVNEAFTSITGITREEALASSSLELNLWVNTEDRQNVVKALRAGQSVTGQEYLFQRKNGEILTGLFSAQIIQLSQGVCILTSINDISKRKETEEALRESEERFRTIFEQAAVGVALLDTRTGRYARINQTYCDFLGYTPQEMLQTGFQNVTYAEDVQANTDHNTQLILGQIRTFSLEKRYVRRDGTIVWGKLTVSPLWKPGEMPEIYFHIAVVEDITERKQAEKELQRAHEILQRQLDEIRELHDALRELSIRDPLTDTYNRRYMEEALKQDYARARRKQYPISIIILDIDHLKGINDTYGHMTGDKALQTLSSQLQEMCRAEDTLCRYGGDEFLVILHDTPASVAYERALQWRECVINSGVEYNDGEIKITFSAGVGEFPSSGQSIEAVMLAADAALYQAKEDGRNCVRVYDKK